MRLKPTLILVALIIVALFAVPGTPWAASIEINQFLLNPSFELGADKACPTSWTCTGSTGVAAYTPTAAQFTPVTDGIPGHRPRWDTGCV